MTRQLPVRLAAIAALLATPAVAGGASIDQVRKACAAPEGRAAPALPGIEVTAMPAAPGDLPFMQVVNRQTGASVRLYHDPSLREVARARAACFGGVLAQLPAAIPDKPDVAWEPIVLTLDRGYIPPRDGVDHRWIAPRFTGKWDSEGVLFLVKTMPHEETHGRQNALHPAPLPRWFQEGHAEWAGLKVTEAVRPDLALAARQAHRKAGVDHPRLGAWGGRRVKPEAIDRQLSPADRERVRREPGWAPPGPFSFSPGDFVEDNDNEGGRYAAALAVFDGLERRHGRVAVQTWVTAVLNSPDSKDIVPLAQKILGEDIAPLLR